MNEGINVKLHRNSSVCFYDFVHSPIGNDLILVNLFYSLQYMLESK